MRTTGTISRFIKIRSTSIRATLPLQRENEPVTGMRTVPCKHLLHDSHSRQHLAKDLQPHVIERCLLEANLFEISQCGQF